MLRDRALSKFKPNLLEWATRLNWKKRNFKHQAPPRLQNASKMWIYRDERDCWSHKTSDFDGAKIIVSIKEV